MSYIAVYVLSNPILQETRRTVPDVEFEVEDEQPLDGEPPRIIFWARGSETDLERFERELSTDQSISEYVFLSEPAQRRLFRVTLSPEGERGLTYPVAIELGITFLKIVARGEAVEYRVQVPTKEVLQAYRRHCCDRDLGFDLRRLYRSENPDADSAGFGLTARQREVLRVAVERGYFEVPREITTAELASELGISSQALSALVRRGVGALVRNTLVRQHST
ncbi:MAG: helix-turn-helix domain-containing protein [Halorientalis sp.]